MNKPKNNTYYTLIICTLALSFFSCDYFRNHRNFWDEKNAPEVIADKVINNWLARKEIKQYQTDFLNTLHYSEACMALGTTRFAQLMKDTSTIQKLNFRFHKVFESFDTLPSNHVDANVIGVLPFQFYRWNGNADYLRMGLKMSDIQWENPLPDGLSAQTRYWIDDLYMIGILQIEAFRATGNQFFIDRAAQESDAYLDKLQQPNGLFYHGTEAPFYWGRGNGWVAVALAELISVLPPEHNNYTSIVEAYCRMMETLVFYQQPNGMWRQLIDAEGAWEESSATAMFGYAIHIGVSKGILKGKRFTKAYQQAWKALAEHLTDEGNLSGICAGTGQSKEVQYYLDRPRIEGDLHGQAPLLWFACSLLKK